MALTVAPTKDRFMRDGKPFFYLADTVWSVFTNATIAEWEEYLHYRQRQGFNVLQMNILPQHDRSRSPLDLSPFARKPDGNWDFFSPDPAYFARVETMLSMAVEQGFIPALVVLWADFVAGTWLGDRYPNHVMPRSTIEPYATMVAQRFAKFNPIYLVSGDTDMLTSEAEERYMIALRAIKAVDPTALATLHLRGSLVLNTPSFVESPLLDFYMLQSGHGFAADEVDLAQNPHKLVAHFRELPVKRPIINGEPCYEGLGTNREHDRYSAFDVRKTLWQSLLAGAKAGFTYGAHGLWSWHRHDPDHRQMQHVPFHWREAMQLVGAWDMAYARWLFATYDLFSLEPANQLVSGFDAIRAAASSDQSKIAVYMPHSMGLQVQSKCTQHRWTGFHLTDRRVFQPDVVVEGDKTVVRLPPFNSDVLLVGC